MRRDKILFIFKRYKHNNNKISTSENLLFLSIISFVIIIKSLEFIVKNEFNEDNFDINSLKDIKKNQYQFLKHLKKK